MCAVLDEALLLLPVASELLVLSLDLVKNRVVVMGADMRKNFIGTILVGLIEKSPDIKIMKAITKVCVCNPTSCYMLLLLLLILTRRLWVLEE
jgi:hypothetical protein